MKNGVSRHLTATAKRNIMQLEISLMRILEEKPFEKISAVDVCRNADVPRSTFYNYFDDKYDLLRYTLYSIAQEIKTAVDENQNDEQYIRAIIYCLFEMYEKHSQFIKKVSSVNCNSSLYVEIKQLLREILIQRFEKNSLAGKKYNADIEAMAEFYSNGIVYTAKTYIENGLQASADDIVNSLMNIILK